MSHQFSFSTSILLEEQEAANTSLQTAKGEYTQTMRPSAAPSCQPASKWILPGLNPGPDFGPNSTVSHTTAPQWGKHCYSSLCKRLRGKKSWKWASELLWHCGTGINNMSHWNSHRWCCRDSSSPWEYGSILPLHNRPTPSLKNKQAHCHISCLHLNRVSHRSRSTWKRSQVSTKNFFFQDHSHLTYIFEKGFLSDHGFQT